MEGSASIWVFMSLVGGFPNVAGELEQLWVAGLCVLVGCLFKFGFVSGISAQPFGSAAFDVVMAIYLVLARSVIKCSGFSCSIWLLKYFAMDMELVGCSRQFVFGDGV